MRWKYNKPVNTCTCISRRSIWVLLELVGRWTQQFLIKLTTRNILLNKLFCIWNPMTFIPDLLYKHWFTCTSVWYQSLSSRCLFSRNVPSGEERRETAVFADYSLYRGDFNPKWGPPIWYYFVSKHWSASQAKGFCNSFCIQHYAPRYKQFIAPIFIVRAFQSLWQRLLNVYACMPNLPDYPGLSYM